MKIMSKIGKQPIILPDGVKAASDGKILNISGPKGELSLKTKGINLVLEQDKKIIVKAKGQARQDRSMHGLVRSLIANMVKGVTQGFSKKLRIMGTGYRAKIEGKDLVLSVGFSHNVTVKPPIGIEFSVGQTTITVAGIDKQLVGAQAAMIRSIRPPDAYKGKGIRYFGEVVKKKPGKAAKAAAA